MTDTSSPSSLQLRKTFQSGPRLGKRGLAVAGLIAGVAVALVIYNTEARKRVMAEKPVQDHKEATAALRPAETAKAFVAQASDAVIAVQDAKQQAAQQPTVSPTAAPIVPPLDGLQHSDQSGQPVVLDQQAAALRQQQEADLRQAASAPMSVQSWNAPTALAGSGATPSAPPAAVAGPTPEDQLHQMMAAAAAAAPGAPGAADQTDPNGQRLKAAFLAGGTDLSTPILGTTAKPQVSPYELQTGTVIHAITLQALNSDLPGQVIGMVTEPVYDSASGTMVMIPAGAKLFGKYDSQVAFGQSRLLVCWQRVVFPDGQTLELGCMQGGDTAGAAGFADQVSNHYGRLLGFGVATSLFSAAFQLSQPQENSANGQLSNRQVVAGAVGQELSQLGADVTRRNLNVQPTIVIRPGYRFVVTLNKDVVFPKPYGMPPVG